MTRGKRLTPVAGAAIAPPVLRLLSLVLGMALLVSVGVAPLAHAREQICISGSDVAAAAAGHVDGDGDQAPDGEKAVAHHHGGCHGHHFAGLVTGADTKAPSITESRFFALKSALPAPGPANRSLRPPIA